MATYYVDTDGVSGDYSSLWSAIPAQLTENLLIYCARSTGVADVGSGIRSIDLNGYSLEIVGDFADTQRSSTAYAIHAESQYARPFSITFTDTAGGGSWSIKGIQFGTYFRDAFNVDGIAGIVEECLAFQLGSDVGNGFWNSAIGTAFINCFAIDNGGYGFYNNGNAYAYNCHASGNGATGFQQRDYRFFYLKNCYSGGNTGTDFARAANNPERMELTTCASSDTSGSTGLQEIEYSTSAGAYFTSITVGSEDFAKQSTSELIGVGTDLSADASFPFSVDILGNTRSAWDIGIDEYQGGAIPPTPINGTGEQHQAGSLTLTITQNISGTGEQAQTGTLELSIPVLITGIGNQTQSGLLTLSITQDISGTGEQRQIGTLELSTSGTIDGIGEQLQSGTLTLTIPRFISGIGNQRQTGAMAFAAAAPIEEITFEVFLQTTITAEVTLL